MTKRATGRWTVEIAGITSAAAANIIASLRSKLGSTRVVLLLACAAMPLWVACAGKTHKAFEGENEHCKYCNIIHVI